MSTSPREHEHSLPTAHLHSPARLGVVLVAAGKGERLKQRIPKSFVQLHGRTLLEFSIATVTSLPHTGHLVIVIPDGRAAEALDLVQKVLPETSAWEVSVTAGGRERYESVRFGLDALPESVETVLVHDAARPFASAALFERVLTEVIRTGDSVVPAIPVADTLKRVDTAGLVHETIDRASLVAVQTPQGFVREDLAAAHATSQLHSGEQPMPTDDAELMQRTGGTVRTVVGEERAHKLTTPADLTVLEALYERRAAEALEEQ